MLNTNSGNSRYDHDDMIKNKKAAAYFTPWKYKIDRLAKGDTVFLYESAVGIVAIGKASGKLEKAPYHGKEELAAEEHFMCLDAFRRIDPPLPASEIKTITNTNYRFLQTMFSIDEESGNKLRDHINNSQVL